MASLPSCADSRPLPNRWRNWGSLVAIVLFSPAVSCGSQGAGAPDAGPVVQNPYGQSPCAACVMSNCDVAVVLCKDDPECAGYLACLTGCPVGATGNVDTSCAAGCAWPEGSAGSMAAQSFTACRETGPGALCSSCLGPGTASPILDQTCGLSNDPTRCGHCEDEYCCNTYMACATSPECKAIEACVKECAGGSATSFTSCEDACYASHTGGLAQWAARLACLHVYCADVDACGNVPLDACEKCIDSSCAEAYVDLYGTPQGLLLTGCAEVCAPTDSACTDGCLKKYPAAAPAFPAFATCATQRCNTPCGG